jgi:flagellar motor component MotA
MALMKRAVDKATVGGIVIALTGIGCGLVLDGGKIAQIIQPTAALIVFGGTLGAVLVQFPLNVVLQAFVQLKEVFMSKDSESDELVQNLLSYAIKARKEGILSLDSELNKIQDPFLRESLMLAIDGVKPADLRRMMELQLDYRGEKDDRFPKVFEPGSDPGNAAPAGHQRSRQRNCRGLCCHYLRRGLGQSSLSALGRKTTHPHSRTAGDPGDDA